MEPEARRDRWILAIGLAAEDLLGTLGPPGDISRLAGQSAEVLNSGGELRRIPYTTPNCAGTFGSQL